MRTPTQASIGILFLFLAIPVFSQVVIKDSLDITPKKSDHGTPFSSSGNSYPTVMFTLTFNCPTQHPVVARILHGDACTQEYDLDVSVSVNGTYTFTYPAPPPSVGIGLFYYAWQDDGDPPLAYTIDGIFSYTGDTIHAEGSLNPGGSGLTQNPPWGGIWADTPYITGFDFVFEGSIDFGSRIYLDYYPYRNPDPAYLSSGTFYAHVGSPCADTAWSESRDRITLQITNGSQYVSFYAADPVTQKLGDQLTLFASELNSVILKADSSSEEPVTVTVKATGGYNVEKERSMTLQPTLLDHFDVRAVPETLQHGASAVLFVQAKDKNGGDIDFDGDIQVTASPDGYGELEGVVPSIAGKRNVQNKPDRGKHAKSNQARVDVSDNKPTAPTHSLTVKQHGTIRMNTSQKALESSEPLIIGYGSANYGFLLYRADGPLTPDSVQVIAINLASVDDTLKKGNGRVVIKKFQTTNNPPRYAQDDTRWADSTYDHTDETIEDIGCALCSMAWVMTAFGDEIDPGQLNKWMNERKTAREGGFFGSSVNWNAMRIHSGNLSVDYYRNNHFKDRTNPNSPSLLDPRLSAGSLVIVQVHDPDGNQHWVTVKGKDYSIMDAGFSGTSSLTDYHNEFWSYVVVSKTKGK